MDIYEVIHNNKNIIAHLDDQKYPGLCFLKEKTSVIRHLLFIMEYMVQPGRWPTYPRFAPTFFSFSRDHMAAWCKDHGCKGSPVSWQSHKILLTDMGLLKTFNPIGEQEDPVLQQAWEMRKERSITFWSVPLYEEHVLQHAEEVYQEYRQAHVNLSHISKNVIIRARNQEIANSLYKENKRFIGVEERTIFQFITEVTNQCISEKGYATTEEVENGVNVLCADRLHFRSFFPDEDIDPVEIDAELKRQRPFKYALRNLMNQKRLVFELLGCDFRPIRKTDRENILFPPDFSKWIIVKKPAQYEPD